MTVDEIKQEALKNWFSEDGLILLNPGEDGPGYGSAVQRTAANDNGIYFAAHFYWLCKITGVLSNSDLARFAQSVALLQRSGIKGLYNRNPGRDDDGEAFDNYIGIVSGSVLFDLPFTRDIVEYGDEHGYNYNNVEPGKWNLFSWRQGAEVAFYSLCRPRPPTLWNLLWLVFGTIINTFQDIEAKSSEYLLTWQRLRDVEHIYNTKIKDTSLNWAWMYHLVILTSRFWSWRLDKKTDGMGIERLMHIYFLNPQHPCRLLSKGVKF